MSFIGFLDKFQLAINASLSPQGIGAHGLRLAGFLVLASYAHGLHLGAAYNPQWKHMNVQGTQPSVAAQLQTGEATQ